MAWPVRLLSAESECLMADDADIVTRPGQWCKEVSARSQALLSRFVADSISNSATGAVDEM